MSLFTAITGAPTALFIIGIVSWLLLNPINLVSYKRDIFQSRADSDNILLSLIGQIQILLLNLAEFLFKFLIFSIIAFVLCAFFAKH